MAQPFDNDFNVFCFCFLCCRRVVDNDDDIDDCVFCINEALLELLADDVIEFILSAPSESPITNDDDCRRSMVEIFQLLLLDFINFVVLLVIESSLQRG